MIESFAHKGLRELFERGRSAKIRQELAWERAQGEEAVQERIATLEAANAALREATNERVAAAEQQTRAALSQYETLVADQEQILAQRLQEQAELVAREKQEAVSTVNARHFEETQRLSGKLEDLARQLERKTANELGEGAEIDLFGSLKQEFEGDQIRRVSKGAAGADIIHGVVHGGKVWRPDRLRCQEPQRLAQRVRDQASARSDRRGGRARDIVESEVSGRSSPASRPGWRNHC